MTMNEHDLETADLVVSDVTKNEDVSDGDELFAEDDRRSFDQRWTEVQTQFVDDPRDAVASADRLVAEVMQAMAERFADQKASLEEQWSGEEGEEEVRTEDLRQAMRSYRSFFRRLLAA